MHPIIFIAAALTSITTYFAMRAYVAEANARHVGESDESWLSRQRDPSTAGLVALLLGLPGVLFVMFSMHRWPRALGMTTTFAVGSVFATAFFCVAVAIFHGAIESVGHQRIPYVALREVHHVIED